MGIHELGDEATPLPLAGLEGHPAMSAQIGHGTDMHHASTHGHCLGPGSSALRACCTHGCRCCFAVN